LIWRHHGGDDLVQARIPHGPSTATADLSRRVPSIHPDQAKSRRPITVPLNDEAVVVLRGERGKHSIPAFTFPNIRVSGTRFPTLTD
jgi:hypothetical protein